MKKVLAVCLIFAVLFSVVGCSGAPTSDNPTTQTGQNDTQASSAPEEKAMDLGAFEKFHLDMSHYPDANVESKENNEWKYTIYSSKNSDLNHVLISAYLGTDKTIVIPDTLDGAPVVHIGFSTPSFASNINMEDITDIQFPDTLYFIASNYFNNTAWYKNQPDGLVYAGNVAYSYKGNAPENTNIVLKEGTTGIAGYAFNQDGIKSITMPDSVISIGNRAFAGCNNMEKIHLSNSLVSINGAFAFDGCKSLKEIHLPESLYAINRTAFDDCSLSSINYAGSSDMWKKICKRTRLETYASITFGQ